MNRNAFFGEAFKFLIEAAFPGLNLSVAAPKHGSLHSASSEETLVVVFLRGACDGLNFVPPLSGEDRKLYEAARPNISLPLTGDAGLLALDERFGLHPCAPELLTIYKAGKLAIVHSAGLPSDSRSHFEAQAMMELGTPDRRGTPTGWLTRVVEQGGFKDRHRSALPAVAAGKYAPTSLLGEPSAAVVADIREMNIAGPRKLQGAEELTLRRMYQGSSWIAQAGTDALRAMSEVRNGSQTVAKDSRPYPRGEIGRHLRTLSQLIRMKIGIRVASVDMGGWDTHRFQGVGKSGTFAGLVTQLSRSLDVFLNEVSGHSVTVIVMSEFGRRLKENANHGTDHGHGNIMMALGEGVRGGKVYGNWRGLKTENLYDRADLAVTTDYRQVLYEYLHHRMKLKRMQGLFRGFHPSHELGLFS